MERRAIKIFSAWIAIAACLSLSTVLWAKEESQARLFTGCGPTSEKAMKISLPKQLVDVRALNKTFWEPDGLEEEKGGYHGIGISVKLAGGWNTFSSGDIDKSARGMFEQSSDAISSSGYAVEGKKTLSFHSGYDLGGAIIYNLNPRIGIGLRFGYVHARRKSVLRYHEVASMPYNMWSMPEISAVSFRPGLYYALPVHRLLTICVNGGPELHLVKYEYRRQVTTPEFEERILQEAKAKGFGFHGGIGLEFDLNQVVAILVEAQGRYAKITKFKGKESFYEWRNWQSSVSEKNGFLYYVNGEKYPRLDILQEESSGDNKARKAVFDFTGVSLVAGLRFRF